MTKGRQTIMAFGFGIAGTIAIVTLAIFFPVPTPFQYTVFRIILALATAGIAAMIPGFLEVQVPQWVRAGGALAVFFIVFFYNPAALVVQEPDNFEEHRSRALLLGFDGALALGHAVMGEDLTQEKARLTEYLHQLGLERIVYPENPLGDAKDALPASTFQKLTAGALEARDLRLARAFELGWFGVISTNTPSLRPPGFGIRKFALEAGFHDRVDLSDRAYLQQIVLEARSHNKSQISKSVRTLDELQIEQAGKLNPSRGEDIVPFDIAVVRNGSAFYNTPIECALISTLNEKAKDLPYDIKFESATGYSEADADDKNREVFKSLLSRYPPGKPDLLITLGTGVSEYAVRNYRGKLRVVFVGVTDPVASGLVKSYAGDRARGQIAGTVYDPPMDLYVKRFAEVFPGKRIGYLYSTKFAQDRYFLDKIIAFLKISEEHLDLVPIEINEPKLTAEQEGMADVFFGRQFLSSHFAEIAASTKKPFAGADLLNLHKDAVITMAADPAEIGKLAAEKIIYPFLTGSAVLSDIPIQIPRDFVIGVNLQAARRYGISIPSDVIAVARRIR
jgi:ABC-type uncharacterized transport system substrate-binding protein